MALEAGTRLGPYEILAPLGAGGMGEVYRARDPRLRREVALKVLPAGLASPDHLERFEREAQTLAVLNHPHIVTIHSVEEAEGVRFLTMELVEGQTLAELVPKGGLPLSRFFRFAIPLAEAVSAAHEKGVTHRDLKPSNVMVTGDGRVKVLDFGLAKLKPGAEGTVESQAPTKEVTEPGRVLGTAPYMSPEQVQGVELDHRSDVFSLGIMLYELLTGERPFQGSTRADLISSIMRDTPPPVVDAKAELPRELGKLIKRCLEKEPARRFQSVLDLRNELEELKREVDTGEALSSTGPPPNASPAGGLRRLWLVGGAVVVALALGVGYLLTRPSAPVLPETRARRAEPATERPMLVVLPFENLGSAEDAYFAAGMTEEITSRLARVSGLGVISRTSAVQYDRSGKTMRQVGEDLGVGFVLEGTVRWDRRAASAERVRITPQLIRVADDTHLWADSYDRVLDDVFAAQSDIAQAVVEQLGVTLLPEEQQRVDARPTENMEAYQAYLKGRERLQGLDWSREAIELALQMLERAVALDPSFTEAHASLALAQLSMHQYDATPERLTEARAAAERALSLDPESAEAHFSLGRFFLTVHGAGERALEEFTLALERSPNDSGVILQMGLLRHAQGRFDEGIALLSKALALDPRNATSAFFLAEAHRLLRRFEEADRYLDLSISLAPDQGQAYRAKAQAYQHRGLLERARTTLESMPREQHFQHLNAWVEQELWEGNYQAALDLLAAAPDEALDVGWRGRKRVLLGQLHGYMDQPELSRGSYEAAVAILEKVVKDRPDDPFPHSFLAEAYAGLGRKAEAIREGKRAVDLLPFSKDAYMGGLPPFYLGRVFAALGEHDAALDQFEYVLSIPGWVSVWNFRYDPFYDPLRDHPRFEKLLAEGAHAEVAP